jgi:endonuclease/exonuclease/phosphatase family metal-dependent hydrolase
MKLMTFNILYGTAPTPAGGWPARRKLVADVIERWDPDVAGLQEAMADQLADLAADLPGYSILPGPISGTNRLRAWAGTVSRVIRHSASVTPNGKDRLCRITDYGLRMTHDQKPSRSVHHAADRGEHCAILYRTDRFRVAASGAFWLSEQPEQPGSLLRGTWQPRVVHWARLAEARGQGHVTVYNAHMDYLPWAPPRSGKILRERLDRDWDGTPQFLIGDLNTPTHSAAVRRLLRSDSRLPHLPPLRDAWAEAAQREGPLETLHRGTGRGSWPGRIDHILFRARMAVERLSTVTHCAGSVYPSDHFPVVAEMRREERVALTRGASSMAPISSRRKAGR